MLISSTTILLFFLLLTYALFLLSTRKSEARSVRLQQRVAEALRESRMLSENEAVQITRDDSIGGSASVNRLLTPLGFVKKLDRNISQADIHITVSRLLAFCLFAALLAALAAYTIFNVVFAVGVALIAGSLPVLHVARIRRKRLNKFNAQLPDSLDLLSRSLSVGHAFSESLNQVASEMPEPIAGEFRITFEEQKLGLSTKIALDRLADRIPIPDLRLCITAMHIQRETGGNLAEILERVGQTIRERFKLMEDFRTMTTSARGSAWILCGLPIAIILTLTAINPKYMGVLLHDPRGHWVIAVAMVLQGIGILLIKKILSIKV
jgi:tight adherence protein B